MQGIDEALTPIIGKRGVAALHQRTVHLARGSSAWLIVTKDGVPTAMDFEALKTALAQAIIEQQIDKILGLVSGLLDPALRWTPAGPRSRSGRRPWT